MERDEFSQDFQQAPRPSPVRDDLVGAAVSFLTNPKVEHTPEASKRRFLTERKGLTVAEVDEAFRRAYPNGFVPSVPPGNVSFALLQSTLF